MGIECYILIKSFCVSHTHTRSTTHSNNFIKFVFMHIYRIIYRVVFALFKMWCETNVQILEWCRNYVLCWAALYCVMCEYAWECDGISYLSYTVSFRLALYVLFGSYEMWYGWDGSVTAKLFESKPQKHAPTFHQAEEQNRYQNAKVYAQASKL